MPLYKFKVPFSGYSRGYMVCSVEAGSLEEAINEVGSEDENHRVTVRDDMDYDWDDVEVLND